MKNYKQILEAVNRGIKFALDDFEDQEETQGQTNSKVKYLGGTKEWLDLMNDIVDLELPSGTLWCKYNLDVNPNLLSKPENWYGGYYAWGELEPNKTNNNIICFIWSNYKFGEDTIKSQIFKYNDDNLTELQPEDDAAYLTKKLYNYKFHIPTKELFEELINYTQNYWVNNYNPNNIEHHTNDDGIKGLNGRVFIGLNGNQLFIPATGYYSATKLNYNLTDCHLWSSTIDFESTSFAHELYFDSEDIFMDTNYRYLGIPIHPVINL